MRKREAYLMLLSGLLMLCRPAFSAEPEAPSAANEIRELKELIRAQQTQIEKLRQAVEHQQQQLERILNVTPAKPAADSVVQDERKIEPPAEDATDRRLTKVEAETAANKKTLEVKSKQLGNFSFSGDVRVRYEPFIQEGEITRHRERFRARLNVTGNISDEFSGGISLATGSLNDPVSTNQTLTGFFTRKNFALDRAFITYRPKSAKFLKLDAGKFAFPWYRTPLTFDNDLNPEGFAETLSFNRNSSTLKNITFVGFQLPFYEVSNGYDSFVFGGQVQTHFRLSPKLRISLYGAGININRADPIAVALGNRSLDAGGPNTNTLRFGPGGSVVGFASKFAYLDAIMELGIDTSRRFPTTAIFNFVNNVRGPRERSGYWAELLVGRNKESGDLLLGYTFIRIEKDAVIGIWNESDIRASTNVLSHRLNFGYAIKDNVTAQFTAWIGRLANPRQDVELVPPGVRGQCTGDVFSNCEDPYQKRLQFDLTYRF